MPITLRWLDATTLATESEWLRPDRLGSRTAAEVASLPARVGNASATLGDLFRIEGDAGDGRLDIEGDLRHVRDIGRGMAGGHLTIRGAGGPGVGLEMAGGRIEVDGSVGDWAGAAMRGGHLLIRGNAGDMLGAALPGDRLGMRDGTIVATGDAGDDVGLAMRRGLIAIGGRAGQTLGRGMVAGSIFAVGPVGRHPGLGMKRGTLALAATAGSDLPPTFAPSGPYRPPVLTIYLRALAELGLPGAVLAFAGEPERYNGDLLEAGRGEIWAWS